MTDYERLTKTDFERDGCLQLPGSVATPSHPFSTAVSCSNRVQVLYHLAKKGVLKKGSRALGRLDASANCCTSANT